MKYRVQLSSDTTHELDLPSLVPGETVDVKLNSHQLSVRLIEEREDGIELEVDGRLYRFDVHSSSRTQLTLLRANRPYTLDVRSELEEVSRKARPTTGGIETIRSQLPGVVRQVFVQTGAVVETGEALLTLEAMKMENEIRAESSGRVDAVLVEAGQIVAAREDLVRIVTD